MIGIYKIENLINHKVYIGQSIHIERRWKEHCFPSKNTVIAKAIKKYGKENFSFQVLEECSEQELNKKEQFYIKKFNSVTPNGYNIVDYIDGSTAQFINYDKEVFLDIVKDIKENVLSFQEISEKYDLNKSSIYRINNGETHKMQNESYPLRPVIERGKIHLCKKCGKEISHDAEYCIQCYSLIRRKVERPNREELKSLIRNNSFTTIGRVYGVTDNAIRKWCKGYNLPYKVSDIKKINDETWEQI